MTQEKVKMRGELTESGVENNWMD